MPINCICMENTTFTVNLDPYRDREMIFVIPHLTHMVHPHASSDAEGKPIHIDNLLKHLRDTFIVESNEFARVKDKLLKNERTQVAIYTRAVSVGALLPEEFPSFHSLRSVPQLREV